jgi:hypothetical protein
MGESERDSTQDWIVPRGSVPTIGELEARIDEAVVIARASEEGVREVGEIALDAANQAKRAAEMAEASARAAKEAVQGGFPKSAPPAGRDAAEQPPPVEEPPSREVVIDPLQRFNERADAVAARLRKLEGVPA